MDSTRVSFGPRVFLMEEIMNGIELYLVILWALIIGFALGYLFWRPKKVGSFTINYSDPEKDLCTLELKEDIDTIDKLRDMMLEVHVIR